MIPSGGGGLTRKSTSNISQRLFTKYPAIVFAWSITNPRHACHGVNQEEDKEEDYGEGIADYDVEKHSGYAVQHPVQPSISLAIDEPEVGMDRGCNHECSK